jgi:hypothetical protein
MIEEPYVVKFLFDEDDTGIEIHRRLMEHYRDRVMSRSEVYRCGRSETSTAGELISKRFQARDRHGRLTKDWPTEFERGSTRIPIDPPARLRSLSLWALQLQLQLSAIIYEMFADHMEWPRQSLNNHQTPRWIKKRSQPRLASRPQTRV